MGRSRESIVTLAGRLKIELATNDREGVTRFNRYDLSTDTLRGKEKERRKENRALFYIRGSREVHAPSSLHVLTTVIRSRDLLNP